MIWSWIACHPEPPTPPDGGVDTGSAGETGAPPCEPGPEVLADGVDQACNGWADELGVGEPAGDAATILLLGEPGDALGQAVDVGLDKDGRQWLAAGGASLAVADAAPPDGAFELVAVGSEYLRYVGYKVAITDWEGAYLVAADDNTPAVSAFGGTGFQVDEYDSYASITVGPYGFEAADVDADGTEELLTGEGGTLRVFDEPTGGAFGSERLIVTSTFPPSQNFAYQVGEVGDLTGDGLVEITAYQEDDDIGGRAYILPGDLTGTVLNTDVGWSLAGEEPEGQAGWAIALGDIDGDGTSDLVTGAFLAQERSGISYVYPGPVTEDGLLADGIARIEALYDNDFCGVTVETLPDQDGDGHDELVIGCPRDRYLGVDLPGRVEVYSGARVAGTLDATQADRVLVGASPYDQFGYALTADGDATGDGIADLVVGAPTDVQGGEAPSYTYTEGAPKVSGAVYVFASPLW